MADLPHFAFPFVRSGVRGTVVVVEQDTLEHVDACCQVIVRCPTGFRLERPEFGWAWPEFRNAPVNPSSLVSGLRKWEPRAINVRAEEWAEVAAYAIRHISVDVEVSTDGHR
jgi:phage baseplate assembly protein W